LKIGPRGVNDGGCGKKGGKKKKEKELEVELIRGGRDSPGSKGKETKIKKTASKKKKRIIYGG